MKEHLQENSVERGHIIQYTELGKLVIWKQIIKSDAHLTPYAKINFRYTKYLNIKNKSIKVLEDNKTKYSHNLEGWKAPFKHYFKGRNYAGKDQLNYIKTTQSIKNMP